MTEQALTKTTEGPWELSPGWQWVPLGSLCEAIVGGGTPDRKNPDYWNGPVPWASVKDLKTDEISEPQESITFQGLEASAARLVEPGTVVIATRMGLGKMSVAKRRIAINQDLKGLILVPNVIARYLVLFLRSRAAEIERRGSGATVKGIKVEELRRWPVPVPCAGDIVHSLETQHRIVARIEKLLAEVRKARSLLDEMRRDADRMMEAALAETLRVLDAEFPDSPSVGDLVSAGRIELFGGGTPSKSNREYWEGHIPWVSPKDMKRWKVEDAMDHISPTAVAESSAKLIPKETVLVVVRGMILAHTWPVSVTTVEVTINQDMKALSTKGSLRPEYLGYMLRARAPSVLRQVEIAAHGTRRLKTDKLTSTTVPDAPERVQRSVIDHLEAVRSEVDRMQTVLDEKERLLDQLEQSMLERAFRGEL